MPKVVDHEVRRAQIAEATGRVMASRGLEELTLRDIAREDGCSPGILNFYFRDREELLAHASKYLRERTRRRQLESLENVESFEEAILRELPFGASMRDEWKTRFQLWARSAVHPETGVGEAQSFEQYRRDAIEMLGRRGLIPTGTESELAADQVMAFAIGINVLAFFLPETFDADRVREVARQVLGVGNTRT